MQYCSDCKKELNDLTAYKKRSRWQSKCKDCFNKYCVERWKRRKKKAVEYKGSQCLECGYNKSLAALDFHHLNKQDKEASWNKMRLWSWDKIKKELDKCVLLCSNCHRELEYGLIVQLERT